MNWWGKEDIPCKWKPKESRGSNPYIRKKKYTLFKNCNKTRKSHYIKIKVSTHREDIIIINTYPQHQKTYIY